MLKNQHLVNFSMKQINFQVSIYFSACVPHFTAQKQVFFCGSMMTQLTNPQISK